MRQIKILLLFFLLFLILQVKSVFAQDTCDSSSCTDPDPSKNLSCISDVLAKCQVQLSGVKNKEKTLNSQLTLIDGQTKVTTLKIEETNLKVEKLKREISDLSSRIDRIGATLDTLSEVLLRRIIQTYKYNDTISAFDLIFSSKNFADLLESLKYIQVAQAYDKKKLYELQATKLAYHDQQQDKQTRQQEAEKLSKDLDIYKNQLDQQRSDKSELLRITRNDEARYQALVNQLRAEQESITQAISNIGARIGPVVKGDTIAAMGSTGCSSGPHLHFEVYENAKVENNKIVDRGTGISVQSTNDNPSRIWSYLKDPHSYLENGKLGPPLLGYPNDTEITTQFGQLYALGPHTGLDIAPTSGARSGRPVLAADNGIAYVTQAAIDPSWCPPSFQSTPIGKGVIVDHQNGIVTLYWHVL